MSLSIRRVLRSLLLSIGGIENDFRGTFTQSILGYQIGLFEGGALRVDVLTIAISALSTIASRVESHVNIEACEPICYATISVEVKFQLDIGNQ